MKEDAPRWRLDCPLSWLIIFTAKANYFREDIDRREEVYGQIWFPYAINVTLVQIIVSKLT